MLLLLMFTVAAVDVLEIALKTPVVAVVYENLMVLLFIFIVFEAAVEPIIFSMAVSALEVAPDLTVTSLLLMVALAEVPDWA